MAMELIFKKIFLGQTKISTYEALKFTHKLSRFQQHDIFMCEGYQLIVYFRLNNPQ